MENTLENNKIIAEFMGYKPVKCNNGYAWDIGKAIPTSKHLLPIQGRLIGDCDYLKFDSDWNWLMKAVRIIVDKCIDNDDLFNSDYYTSLLETIPLANIEDSYKVVVEFINYYKTKL
jgi:hypothetical protein